MRIDEGKMKVQTALRTARGPARCTIAAIRIRAPSGDDAIRANGVLHDRRRIVCMAIRAKTKPRLGAGASEPAVAEGRRGRSVAGAEDGPGHLPDSFPSGAQALNGTPERRASIRRHAFSWKSNAAVLQAGLTTASAPPIQGCRPSRDPRRRRRPCADRRNRGPGHDGLPKDGPAASIPANGGEIVFCDRIDGSVLAPPVLAGGHRGCPAKPRTVILLRLRGVVFVHKHDSGTGPPPAFPPTPG